MEFREFETLVQSEFMEGALKALSPSISHRQQSAGQYESRYEIGIDIKLCCFLFVWEEEGGAMIAPLASRFDKLENIWFDLARIICFVTHQPFDWESPYQSLPHDQRIITTLHDLQKAFTPHAHQIITMFSSVEKMSQWLEIYEYKVARDRATHIRSGKEEFVRTTSRNKDERVSAFQSSLDYLKKLREGT